MPMTLAQSLSPDGEGGGLGQFSLLRNRGESTVEFMAYTRRNGAWLARWLQLILLTHVRGAARKNFWDYARSKFEWIGVGWKKYGKCT